MFTAPVLVSGFQAGLPPPVALSFRVGGARPTKGAFGNLGGKEEISCSFPSMAEASVGGLCWVPREAGTWALLVCGALL